MAGRRPVAPAVRLATQLTEACNSALQTMQTAYAEEPGNYKADAYWSGGKLWMKRRGRYDRGVMLRLA